MDEQVKIVVTVPANEADDLRQVIGKAGAGRVGNYSYCSFSVSGKGRFLPNEGANPTIGLVGQPEVVEEERIEVTCVRKLAKTVIEAIKTAHSYEEPAIDVYSLLNIDSIN